MPYSTLDAGATSSDDVTAGLEHQMRTLRAVLAKLDQSSNGRPSGEKLSEVGSDGAPKRQL